eukprot:GHVR01155882.1.p1 GENE.GHVR01155882.1~~GHVR01155882.1.p1  ORF type:complete len:374 (+),score=86.07 GHVR01155882.1:45-1166(+)
MSSRLDNISRLIYLTNRLRKTGRNTSQSDAINKFSKRMIANSKPVPLTDNTVIPKPSKRVNYRDNRATVISIVSTGISTSIGDEISSGMCLPPICRNSQSSINPTIRLGEVISQLGIRTTRRSSVPSNARLCSDFSSAELAKFHRVCVGIVALWSAGVVKSLASPSVIESLPRVLPRKKCVILLDGTGAAVADGVGEWGEYGINPKSFALEFISGAEKGGEESLLLPGPTGGQIRARHMLLKGREAAVSVGSATVLTMSMNLEGSHIGWSSLGDCALVVLRRATLCMKIVMITEQQQHQSNVPYQLSTAPTHEMERSARARGDNRQGDFFHDAQTRLVSDTVSDATGGCYPVIEGDLILIGSDGVSVSVYMNV